MPHHASRLLMISTLVVVIAAGAWCLRDTRIGNPVTFEKILPETTSTTFTLSTEAALENQDHMRQVTALYDHSVQGNFRGARGAHIAFRAFLQPASEERAAVVISNGRTESFEIYKEVIYDLYAQKYSVYIHDHRGQGFSDRLYLDDVQRSHVDDFNFYVSDLHQFVHDYVRSAPHKRLFLLAHSMGGGIATRYVERYPGDFDALALVTPMHAPFVGVLGLDVSTPLCSASNSFPATKILSAAEFGLGQDDWHATAFADNDLTHSPIRFAQKNLITNKIGGVTHGWFRRACAASLAAREDAANISIPVLLLQAVRDTAVSNRAQKEFCDGVNGGKGKCIAFVLPDAYHAVLLEKDSLRIPAFTTILDFFASNGGSLAGDRPKPVAGYGAINRTASAVSSEPQ